MTLVKNQGHFYVVTCNEHSLRNHTAFEICIGNAQQTNNTNTLNRALESNDQITHTQVGQLSIANVRVE